MVKTNLLIAFALLVLHLSVPSFAATSELQGLPSFIQNWLEKTTFWDGPNCWNSALVLQGMKAPFPFHTIASEMEYLVEVSGQCRPVADPLVGDLIYIFDTNMKPEEGLRVVHAFTFLGNGWSFTKNGYESLEPYRIQKIDEVLKLYRVDHNVRQVAYFRCAPQVAEIDPAIEAYERRVTELEQALAPQVAFAKRVFTDEQLLKLKDEMWKARAEVLRLSEERPERRRLAYRIHSLVRQIRFMIEVRDFPF